MTRPVPPSRADKKAFQAFITERTLNRFRAACALANKDQSAVTETLMTEFADHMGIPAHLPKPPHEPDAPAKRRKRE